MVVRAIDLQEGEPALLPADGLTTEQALAISRSGVARVQFPTPANAHRFVVESANIVGLIPFPGDLVLRITPKVPIGNLFGMLEAVHELRSFQFYDGIGAVEAIEDIYARLASLLARLVSQRIRRGLYASYVSHEEEGLVVRGRIDVARSLRARARGSVALHCAYELLTPDVEDNHILLWALDRIARMGMLTGEALREVQAARRALLGAVQLTEVRASQCRNRFYNRLNADYALMHALARFFLERMGPGIRAGAHEFLPFSVDMPLLFQEYVVASLKRHAPEDLRVGRQYTVEPEGDFRLKFSMDAVITHAQSERVLAVIDAKYKKHAQPSAQDAEQVIAYATHVEAPQAFLVYPFALPAPGRIRIGRQGRLAVANVGLALDRDLARATEEFARGIFTSIAQVSANAL